MPSPWGAVTETLSRLTQPVRSWGRGVVSDYVVPPQNKPLPAPPPARRPSYPISPVSPQQLAEPRGFISPTPSTPYTPPPPPPPQPTFPSLEGYGTPQPSEEIMNLIMSLFPEEEWENAARVAFGESSYNPGLIGPTNDYGLFQINPRWQGENLSSQGYTIEDMLDLEKNMQFASWLQSQQGWNPWVAARGMGLNR